MLVKKHAGGSVGPFACIGRGANYDFGDREASAPLRKGNALVRDHRTARDAEFYRVTLRLEGPADDAPLGFLAEPRMLAQRNESKKGPNKTVNLRIVCIHQSI